MITTIYWDPSPVAFTIPFVHYPVAWYSLFFALGILGAYAIVFRKTRLFIQKQSQTVIDLPSAKKQTHLFLDKLVLYLFLGIVLGARLGHVFFYDWAFYSAHPEKIFEIPMRGLASHGGAVGVLVGLVLFWYFHRKTAPLSFLKLLDILSIAAAFAACCIRIGNFFNQEIVGTPTTVAWGVVFGHPVEAVQNMQSTIAYHPVQLYESLFYFTLFVVLYFLERKRELSSGVIAGWFFVLTFSYRFFVEYYKLPQGEFDIHNTHFGLPFSLHMGQLLSIPFIIFGIYLLVRKKNVSH